MSTSPQSAGSPAARRRLIESMAYEVVPTSRAGRHLPHLPDGCGVTVTCSPVRGIDPTLDLAEEVLALGHPTVPHLAARMVADRAHLDRIASRLTALGICQVFVVAGDPPEPRGPYADTMAFLGPLLDRVDLTEVGVAGYPDGHPLVPAGPLHEALLAKQALLDERGVAASVTTQMCFDPATITDWLLDARAGGLRMPVVLGIAGVVRRTRLLAMGVQLGVGASLRYLGKNRLLAGRLLGRGAFDPDRLIRPLSASADELGIRGLHAFTFNEVEATVRWQRAALGDDSA